MQSYDSHNRQWRSANASKRHFLYVPSRIGYLVLRILWKLLSYTSSSIIDKKTLRADSTSNFPSSLTSMVIHRISSQKSTLQFGRDCNTEDFVSYRGSRLVTVVLCTFLTHARTPLSQETSCRHRPSSAYIISFICSK